MLLPLVFVLGLGAFIGWRILFIIGVLALIGLLWLIHRARTVPTAERIWLAGATPPRKTEKKPTALRVYTGNRWKRRILELPAGENLCLTGPGAAGFARWVVGQALLYGQGYLSPKNLEPWQAVKTENDKDKLEIRVLAPQDAPACSDHQVALVIAESPPSWAQRIMYLKAKRGRLGEAWFASLKIALEANPSELALAEPDPGESLPRVVGSDLLGEVTPEAITTRWNAPADGLTTTLGFTGEGTPWVLDLVSEGPHALVAGTTGAGKSELLTTWLLGLALQYSPVDLRFILIDYKGGAAFGELERLPHVHGVLTDLQPRLTARALQSLQAFLKARETELARVCARDTDHYFHLTGKRLARVMIVVDEFRALAMDHPEVMENLIRLATHGRSLGLHLILATQKPGGIVNGQILANANLRIALRVRTGADSSDVLGDSRAAKLPAIPGRLYWEGLSEGLAQAAWCGSGSWVTETVGIIKEAWGGFQENFPTATTSKLPEIWLPELPDSRTAPPGAFALTDWPQLGSQQWREPQGLFGIFGNPGTGRTTSLLTLAVGEAIQAHQLVIVSPTPQHFANLVAADPRERVVFSPEDLWQLDRLAVLATEGNLEGVAVLLDRADLVADAFERISPGQGNKRLEGFLSGAGAGGYRVAFSAPLSVGRSSWGTLASERFVLMPRDTVDLHTGGIEAVGTRMRLAEVLPSTVAPGRGVWQFDGTCVEAQVGLPSSARAVTSSSPLESRGLSQLLAELPRDLGPADIPQFENAVTLGWASERNDWATFSPQRYWQVEDAAVLRGLVSQLKREYRRLGYVIQDAESYEVEQNKGKTLLVVSNSEHNQSNLRNFWESFEKMLNFDVTILELVSPGTFSKNLTKLPPRFAISRTNILALSKSAEVRHRLASSFQTDPETLRKLQVTTNFPAIFSDEKGLSPLLFPKSNVRHLT